MQLITDPEIPLCHPISDLPRAFSSFFASIPRSPFGSFAMPSYSLRLIRIAARRKGETSLLCRPAYASFFLRGRLQLRGPTIDLSPAFSRLFATPNLKEKIDRTTKRRAIELIASEETSSMRVTVSLRVPFHSISDTFRLFGGTFPLSPRPPYRAENLLENLL